MANDRINNHSNHSSLVRFLRLGVVPKSNEWDWERQTETQRHALVSPHSGYLVRVSFAEVAEHPDHIRIRSTNWRCEHEPSGWVTKARAREIWKELRKAGMVPEKKD